MLRVMIDLETLGTRSTSAILSIGLVAFDQDKVVREAQYKFDCQQQLNRYGRTIDMSTLSWWMAQSEKAREIFDPVDRLLVVDVLLAITRFLKETGDPAELEVWANGASFDFPILAGLYVALEQALPWRFYNERDYRTVKAGSLVLRPPMKGTAHNALDDARAQAEHLIIIERAERAPIVLPGTKPSEYEVGFLAPATEASH